MIWLSWHLIWFWILFLRMWLKNINKLHVIRSLVCIFEINLQYSFTRRKNIETSFLFLLVYSYIWGLPPIFSHSPEKHWNKFHVFARLFVYLTYEINVSIYNSILWQSCIYIIDINATVACIVQSQYKGFFVWPRGVYASICPRVYNL